MALRSVENPLTALKLEDDIFGNETIYKNMIYIIVYFYQ